MRNSDYRAGQSAFEDDDETIPYQCEIEAIDAVKIRFTPGDDWWYLPIRAQLAPSVATKIDDALRRLTVK